MRQSDSVIRWGGEEFVVILPAANLAQAVAVVRRIMDEELGDHPDRVPVTASMGLAELSETNSFDWKSLIKLADQSM